MLFSGIKAQLFKAFLISIFFLHYQTRFAPGSVNSYLMIVGLLFIAVTFYCSKMNDNNRVLLPFDYALVGILFTLIIISYLLNISTASWVKCQAYILMLLTYIYVKESTDHSTIDFLIKLIRVFLIVNGAFVVAQTITGEFFPAKYIANGNPPLIIPSGVSDGPTKNGFLVAFGASALIANFFFKRLTFPLFDIFILCLSFFSILVTASRAGLVAVIAVIALGLLFAFVQSLRDKRFKLSFRVFLGMPVLGAIINYSIYRSDFLNPGQWGLFNVDAIMIKVSSYKFGNFNDGSVDERFDGFEVFLEQVWNNPLHFLSVGMGPGTFERLNGTNIHNSLLELLITTGVAGLITFLLLSVFIVRKALKSNAALFVTPLIFSLLSVFIFMQAHDILRGRIYWVALGVIAGHVALLKKTERIGRPPS